VIWPLQVDVFIAVGELALFVALADRWASRSRAGAWAVTLAGLAVSVAGNVGHVTGHSPADRLTAAVPPLAAAAALAVGLGVLKRVVAMHEIRSGAADLGRVPGPGIREQLTDLTAPGTALANGHAAPEGGPEAVRLFAAELARGEVPSGRRIRREMHVGQPRAQEVRAYLAALAPPDDRSGAARSQPSDLHGYEAMSRPRTPEEVTR
jgi:hypothetical protein